MHATVDNLFGAQPRERTDHVRTNMTAISKAPLAPLIALATCLLAVPVASAQRTAVPRCPGSSEYRGKCVDVPVVAQAPRPYADCDKARGRSQAELYACFLAVIEAKTMAAQYAGGHGRMFGFHRGFAAGMHDAEERVSSDNRLIDQGTRIPERMGAYMEPGVRTAADTGDREGRQQGAELVHTLFERAVGSGQSGLLPAKSMGVIPTPDYRADANAYDRLVPQNGEFANLSPAQVLERMDREYRRYNLAYDHIDPRSQGYMGDFTRLSLPDLWFSDGVYNFDSQRWLDPQVALRAWLTQPGIPRAQFDTLMRHAPDDVVRDSTTGDPVIGPDGKPVCRRPIKDPTSGAITGCAKADLQDVFRRSFADAYAHYAGYLFSSMLHAALDDGYRQGIIVGTELGRRMALTRGMIIGFNETFASRSRNAFASAFQRGYAAAFDSEFEEYRTHPVLSLEITDVVGEVADGILQPGERFSLRFRVVNGGGLPAHLSGMVSGAVVDPIAIDETIGPLVERAYTTGIVGRVDARLRAGQRAEIRLTINGAITDSFAPVVLRAIQLAMNSTAIDAPDGSATISVSLRNVSTVRTSGEVVATFTLLGRAFSRNVGTINPGEERTATFDVSGQDPLELMFTGANATVRAHVGELLMDEQVVRLLTPSPRESLARYFGLLVQPSGQAGYVPIGVDREQRVAVVMTRIVSINDTETNGAKSNPWKDAPQTTMAGMVRDELRSMPQNETTAAKFRELGDRLWSQRTHFGKFLFFKSGKRKAYEQIVEEIRKGGLGS